MGGEEGVGSGGEIGDGRETGKGVRWTAEEGLGQHVHVSSCLFSLAKAQLSYKNSKTKVSR